MQKQKKQINGSAKKIAIVLFTLMGFAFLTNAQQVSVEELETEGLKRIKTSGDYVDYTIPEDEHKALYLEVKGADGGHIPGKAAGSGAMVKGWMKLGNKGGEIPYGSTIRFIVGEAGKTDEEEERHSSGGGGTAVAFRKPNDTQWHLLIVAGGGGGAATGYYGGEAEITENGTSGKGKSGKKLNNEGKNGEGGGSSASFGGGGAYSPGEKRENCYWSTSNPHTCDGGGGAGFNANNEPTGGAGGSGNGMVTGGFGFGGGGAAHSNRVKNGFIYTSGGGGGGYSGGGGGSHGAGGGGGGSYVNTKWVFFPTKKRNGTPFEPQDGYIDYELVSETPGVSIHPHYAPRKCFDLAGGTGNGTNILVSQCSDKRAQTWFFDGPFIRSVENGDKCLDLTKNNSTNGTNIQLYDCNGSNAQKWVYDGLDKQIRNLGNWDKCLERANNNIRIWDCQGRRNQQWKIDGAIPAEGETRIKTIHLAKDDGKCINLDGANTDNKTSNIHLYDCTGYGAQKWLFDGINIRYYVQQNKCVDLAYSKTNNGTNIRLWDCNRSGAQRWVYEGTTGTIRYRDNLNKCLVVKRGGTTRGTNIEIRDCNGSEDQQWKMKDADTPFGPDKAKSIYRLKDKGKGKDKCMDVDGGGTNIQLGYCTGNTDQQWTYDGLYLRYKKDPSKCLDLKAANTHKGNNIQLYACNGTKAQRWLYDQKDHKIRYADNWNRCLELYRNDDKVGTNIQIYDCRDTEAQQWIIK